MGEACFDQAAAKWKVPAPLLRAIAQAESGGFHNIPPEHDHSGHGHQRLYGVMGLRDDDALGHSLREAAAASKQDPDLVVKEPCANIEAAAALIGTELAKGGTVDGAVLRSWGASNGKEALELFHGPKAGLLSVKVRLAEIEEPEAAWCWRFWRGCGPAPGPAPAPEPVPAPDPIERGDPVPRGNGGEAPGSDWDRSPNFDAGAIRPRFIVLHTTEGNFNGAVSWLKNPKSKVSAHYVVRARDGYVKQLVREKDKAWHARCWNPQAIGIEMEGFLRDPSSFTGPLLRAASRIVKHLSRAHGIPSNSTRIVGHDAAERGMLDGTGLENCNDHGDPGRHFDWSGFWRLVAR